MAPRGGKQTDISDLARNPSLIARAKDAARYMISGVTPNTWMSPQQPLQPVVDTDPRVWNYPTGFNLQTRPRPKSTTADELFALVNNCDLLKIIIERRKDQLQSLPWQVKPKQDSPATPDDPRIKAIEALLRFPDKEHDWNTWLRRLLDDLFVLDAVAIYRRRDRKGRLFSLDLLPGETIKVNIDGTGRRPLPPDPAYQQVLYGMPAVDFSSDELIYAPRNLSRGDPYGRSPVEWILATVNIAIRRAASQLSYYSDGNLSDGVFWLPPEWPIDQVKAFQEWWDAIHTGNLAERRKAKFVPGNKDSYQQIVQPPLKDEYDEWLARVICFAFSISPTPFIKQVNRATAESAQKAALEEGLAPLEDYIKSLIDRVIFQDFGADDLEFCWKDDSEQDPLVAAQIRASDVKSAIISIDEARSDIGRDPMGGAAEKLGTIGATGFVALPSPEAIDAQDAARVAGSQAATDAAKNPPDDAPEDTSADPAPAAKRLKKNSSLTLDRAAAAHARSAIHKQVAPVLKNIATHVAAQLRGMHVMGKADDDQMQTDAERDAEAQRISDAVNLSELRTLKTLAGKLSDVAIDAGNIAVTDLAPQAADILGGAQAEIETGMFNQVNERAVAWANSHAADLVTQITDNTREMLRQAIAQGMAETDIGGIADKISELYAFSDKRALLIADTEVANANGQGALEGYRSAAKLGLKVMKEWLPDSMPCPICELNADEGPIPIEEPFPSGDMTTPGHPRCLCTTIATVEE